jgi:hypothetical protein
MRDMEDTHDFGPRFASAEADVERSYATAVLILAVFAGALIAS